MGISYVSNANGNWSTSSIWTPNGVPGANDTVSIAHAVTITANTTIGDGTASTVLSVGIASTGSLTITGATLTIRGNSDFGYYDGTTVFSPKLTVQHSGSTPAGIIFDGNSGVTPTMTLDSNVLFTITGTSSARCSIRTKSAAKGDGSDSAGHAGIITGTSNYYSFGMAAVYFDLYKLGDASNVGINQFVPWYQNGQVQQFTWDQFTVDHCGVCPAASVAGAVANFQFTNGAWSNALGNVAGITADASISGDGTALSTGTRLINNCVFSDKTAFPSSGSFKVSSSLFLDYLNGSSGGPTCALFDGNFIYRSATSVTDELESCGGMSNCYYYNANPTINALSLINCGNSTTAGLTISVLANVFEQAAVMANGYVAGIGNGEEETDNMNYIYRYNIFFSSGSGSSFSPALATNSADQNPLSLTTYEHNTIVTNGYRSTGPTGRVGAVQPNCVVSVKGNLFVNLGSSSGVFAYDNACKDPITSSICGNYLDSAPAASFASNCCKGFGSVLTGHWSCVTGDTNHETGTPYSSPMSGSVAPGANDLPANTDPMFVATPGTVGLAAWDTHVGGPGTVADALTRLQANTSLVKSSLLPFVRAAFTPTNSALEAASFSGDISTTDANGNPWLGAGPGIGAMSLASTAAFTLAAPGTAKGDCTVASGNFTVTPLTPQTVVVTPNDGGAGGTFTPTTLSWTSSAAAKTFTYTPQLVGNHLVAVTNNASLGNPPPVNYLGMVQLGSSGTASSGNFCPSLGGQNLFANGTWLPELTRDISGDPVAASSADLIAEIVTDGGGFCYRDFSATGLSGGNGLYGIPYNVVAGTQTPKTITYTAYPSAVPPDSNHPSDPGPVPILTTGSFEGFYGGAGVPPSTDGPGDQHCITLVRNETTGLVDTIWESETTWTTDGGVTWNAHGGCKFNIATGAQRPDDVSTAEAGGMIIMLTLVRYDEVALVLAGLKADLGHAVRCTVRYSEQNYYAWPARCVSAGGSYPTMPLGGRLRLNNTWYQANKGTYSGQARVLIDAMAKYGMVNADNSGLSGNQNPSIEGVSDDRWDTGTTTGIGCIGTIPVTALELIQYPTGWTFTGPTSGPVGVPQTFTIARNPVSGPANYSASIYLRANGSFTGWSTDAVTLADSSPSATATFTPPAGGTYTLSPSTSNQWYPPPDITFTAAGWTFVQSASAISNGVVGSISKAFNSAVTPGNKVVVVVTASNTSASPVTMTFADSTDANTYYPCGTANPSEGPSPYFYTFQAAFSVVASGGAFTVTANPGVTAYLSISISEWSTTLPYCAPASMPASASFSASPASAGNVNIVGNDLVVGAFMQFAVAGPWTTPGAGYTAIQNTPNIGSVQQGILVEYAANVTSSPANPGATLAGAEGACFGFALKESSSAYAPVDLNYYVSQEGLLVIALTSPLPSSATGVYPIEYVTAVNASPTVQVNGHNVAQYGPIWSDTGHFWAFAGYWLECGKVASIPMSSGGHGYTSPSAAWSGSSGGGTSLVLGTPVLGVGVTSYTIVSPGSGMTDGTYQWLIAAQGASCSQATAWVTVAGGAVTSVIPICGSVFGMGAGYSGSTISGLTFASAGGSAGTITGNISNYVQSIPVVSSSHDFTSQPTITITDSTGSGAVAAPIMSGPAATDTVTMSLAAGAIGSALGTTGAVSNAAVTNWVGQVEGATGHLLGFGIQPTIIIGGDVGSEMVGGTSNHFLAKNKFLTMQGWSGTSLVLDSNGFPVSAAPNSNITCTVLGDFSGADCPPQGNYKIIYDDAFYISGAPAATVLTVGSIGNCSRPSYTSSRSGTTVTLTQPISLLTDFAAYNYGLTFSFAIPSDGLWHLSNLRVLAPGNTDTFLTVPEDVDDQVVAALTGPGGETPGCLRFMDNVLSGGGNTNYVTAADVPAFGNLQTWVNPPGMTPTISITSVRTLNTGSLTRGWSSTKQYVWQDGELPLLSDGFGKYLDMTTGPLGTADLGNISQVANGQRSSALAVEVVCSAPHGFKTLQWVSFPAFGSGITVTASISGSTAIFNGPLDLPVFVTGANTFFILYPVGQSGDVLQYLADTSTISTPGWSCALKSYYQSPVQFGANLIKRLPGTAMITTVPGAGSTALYQRWMDWIAPYLVGADNDIYIEYGDEPWNTGDNFSASVSHQCNWSAYVPSGSSCFGGFYTSNGTSLFVGGSTYVEYTLKAGAAFRTCLAELVAQGISSSRVHFIYSGFWNSPGDTAIICNTIATYGLPLGSVSIAPYTGGGQGDVTTIAAMQPAGYPPGAGNLPVSAINDFIKHTLALSPNNWSVIGSHISALTSGMTLCGYEGGITNPLQEGIIHQSFLAEDMVMHASFYPAVKAWCLLCQVGNPLQVNGGMILSNYYALWYWGSGGPLGPYGTWIGQDEPAGRGIWKVANGYAQPKGSGASSFFYTPQGGPGSDGSHPAGYSAGVGYAGNRAYGIEAILDFNAAIAGGVVPTTTATLTGPTTGLESVASANFTVALDGTTYTGTVTPSDSAAGGTFTPASLTWSGTAGSRTFTYTPATLGAISISIAASPSLTYAGSPITYTSYVASSTATLSGPTSGLVSVASTNFTVALTGTSYTGTVTPSDSSGGGTFTPASLTWSGTAGSKTFTYTPGTTGTKSISITASPTLTISGSPIAYAVSMLSTTATLSGPSGGLVSVASTNFTVTLNGTSYTGTVTPSDSSGGGTFSPSSLSWTATATPKTFTYTPGTVGAKSISITASPSLTYPGSPITYTVSAISYALTGPSGGVAHVASANFTVAPSTTTTDTITFSAGGGGGTFTPSSLSWSGTSGAKTFTYTPTTAGAKTLTLTSGNSDAITGSPATYTVTAIGYTLGGPTTAFAGVAVTYTLTPAAAATDTLSFSDGGGGGTFDPTTLTWSGTSGAKTFTYDPASTGTKVLTVTSADGGVVSGSPLSLVVSDVSYTLSGPAVGAVGIPSTFTLVPAAVTTDTITLSDGAGFGTFTPTSLSFTGTGAAKTFTYTPASTGSKTITLSSFDGGVIAGSPAALSVPSLSYRLMGPSTGIAGYAQQYTLLPSLPVTDTITFSDASDGGTFSPSSLVIVSSAAPQTWYYTPGSTGTKVLTLTSAEGGSITGSPLSVVVSASGSSNQAKKWFPKMRTPSTFPSA